MFVKFVDDCELRCTPGKDKLSRFLKGDEAEVLYAVGDLAVRRGWAIVLPRLGAIVRPSPIEVATMASGKANRKTGTRNPES